MKVPDRVEDEDEDGGGFMVVVFFGEASRIESLFRYYFL